MDRTLARLGTVNDRTLVLALALLLAVSRADSLLILALLYIAL